MEFDKTGVYLTVQSQGWVAPNPALAPEGAIAPNYYFDRDILNGCADKALHFQKLLIPCCKFATGLKLGFPD